MALGGFWCAVVDEAADESDYHADGCEDESNGGVGGEEEDESEQQGADVDDKTTEPDEPVACFNGVLAVLVDAVSDEEGEEEHVDDPEDGTVGEENEGHGEPVHGAVKD